MAMGKKKPAKGKKGGKAMPPWMDKGMGKGKKKPGKGMKDSY